MLKSLFVSNQDNQILKMNHKKNKNNNNNNNNKNKIKNKKKNKMNKILLNSQYTYKRVMDKFYVMNVQHNKEKYNIYNNI